MRYSDSSSAIMHNLFLMADRLSNLSDRGAVHIIRLIEQFFEKRSVKTSIRII